MTLPAEPNSISSSQINVELGRSSTNPLLSSDADLIAMAERSDFTIPDDLWGKSYLGPLQGTFTVTVGTGGGPNPSYGYQNSPAYGSLSPITYRGVTGIQVMMSENAIQSYDFRIVSSGIQPANLITAVHVVDEDVWFKNPNHATSSVTSWSFLRDDNGGPWGAGDVGNTKTVRLYGL